MKMQRAGQLVLGLAISLLLSTTAWANHTFTLNFAIDWIPNDWHVRVNGPKGYAPNSECMTVWEVPDPLFGALIAVNHFDGIATPISGWKRFFTIQITDKDDGLCYDKHKYNTWEFSLEQPLGKWTGPRQTGKVQFNRQLLDGYKVPWMTWIAAENTDGQNKPLYVSSAICDSGAGLWWNCLNYKVGGRDAADTIWIFFKYKP